MVVAEVARKSPFDNDGANKAPSSRNIALEVIGVGILGLALLFVRLRIQEDFHVVIHSVIAFFYAILIFKNITYGTIVLIIAIGVSPDSVGYPNVRYEDYMFPPLLIIWWFQRMSKQQDLYENDVLKAIKVYMLIVFISTVQGILAGTVWSQWIAASFCFKYIEYFLLFWFACNSVRDKEDIVMIVIASFVTCAFVAYISYSGRAVRMAETGIAYVRASGPEGETPNILGGYYMMNMMLAFAMLFSIKNYIYKLILLSFLLAVALPLLYTYSRTSFASLLIGLAVTSLFIDLRFIIILAIFAFLFPILLPFIGTFDESGVVDRYSTILEIFGDDSTKPSSWTARMSGWYIHIMRAWDSNVFLGRGVGSIGLGIDSSYVKKFIETGLFGLVAFSMVLIRIGRMGLENIKKAKDDFFKSYCVGYLGGFSGMLVHAVGVSSFSTIRTAEPFWIFTGLMLATGIISERTKELEDEEEEDWKELSFVKSDYK